jgi:hypothetical protein
MKKPSQKDRVVQRLLKVGYITRNECLGVFISRLSAIIYDLEQEGWTFETSRKGGNYKTEADYVYTVTRTPYKKIVSTLANGEQVVRITK